MAVTVSIRAKGHPNVRSTHKTTFMTTKEPELSTRGDCIISVSAEIGLKDMPEEAKLLARDPETRITFALSVGEISFEATGWGHPDLEYTDHIDMVARRSEFTCGRTLMIKSDKTSQDLPEELISALKDPDSVAEISIKYEKTPVSS